MAHKTSRTTLSVLLSAGLLGGALAQGTAPVQPQSTPVTTAAPGPASDLEGARTDGTRLDSARKALAARDYRAAQTLFETALATRYEDPEAHFGLGLALYGLGDLIGARFEFQQLVRLAPERYEGHYNLGVVATRARLFDEALGHYRKALETARAAKSSDGAVLTVLAALGAELARRGDDAELIKTLGDTLVLKPTDHSTRLSLAEALVRVGRGAEALPHAHTVLTARPGDVNAALLIAGVYAAQNLPDRAARELDRVLTVTTVPADRAALLSRKGDLLAGEQPKVALAAYQAAVKLTPRDAELHARLASFLTSRGDRRAALGVWQDAVKLAPKNAVYRASLAGVQLALGQADAARASAQLAQKDATSPTTRAAVEYVLGVANYRQGRYDEARRALGASAAVTPGADTYLWLGLSEYALKNYGASALALEASVRLAPSPASRAALGAALMAGGRLAEAETTLRALVSEDPRNGEAWYNLGWTVRGQGREAEARKAFQTSASLGYSKARGELR